MSGDKDLQFLDTNVLLYAHDQSAGEKQHRAGSIVAAMWESGNGCLSVQVLQEFYVNITQKVAQRLDKEAALQIVADLACWRIHVPDAADVLKAIEIQLVYKISFWDAMIIRSAQAMRCQTLWTEDLQAGQTIAGVRAVNPFALQGN
jgi:predicted nucleic acid-binding protein